MEYLLVYRDVSARDPYFKSTWRFPFDLLLILYERNLGNLPEKKYQDKYIKIL